MEMTNLRQSQRTDDEEDLYGGGPPDGTGLNPQQKQLITEAWNVVRKNMQGNGLELFVSFFKAYPQYTTLFSAVKLAAPQQMKDNKALRAHSLVVMYSLSAIIEQGINDPSLLEAQLNKLARNHITKKVSPSHFQNFSSSLLQFLRRCLGKDMTPQMESAWACLMNKILAVVNAAKDSSDD